LWRPKRLGVHPIDNGEKAGNVQKSVKTAFGGKEEKQEKNTPMAFGVTWPWTCSLSSFHGAHGRGAMER
jgi:hypothetical protein